MGRFDWYDRAMATHTVTRARVTDRATADSGRLVNERAAAGGPMSRLKMSSDPTTGTAMVVVRAMTPKKARSMRALRMPLASAASGTTEASSRGRYSTATADMHTTAMAAGGRISLLATPSTSPNSSE